MPFKYWPVARPGVRLEGKHGETFDVGQVLKRCKMGPGDDGMKSSSDMAHKA